MRKLFKQGTWKDPFRFVQKMMINLDAWMGMHVPSKDFKSQAWP